jgi:hypothetical protein
MPFRRPVALVIWLMYCFFITLQFIRFYSVSTIFYLKMPVYLAGHERLPFQERVLPIFLLKPMFEAHWLMRHAHPLGPFSPDRGPFYLLSLVAFLVAGFFVQKLYNAVSESDTLGFLVYPLFLFTAMFSYVVHIEANFSYPYDMLSLAFFSAGLYFIYTRSYLPVLAIMLVGTMNRETTLFLVGIYVIDAATINQNDTEAKLPDRFSFHQVPWLRATLLALTWVIVKIAVAHIYAHNDPSENYVRILENVSRLKPRLWPSLLNICGYVLPIVWLFRRMIRPVRFANYLYILPFWFAIMFYTGVIVETRIYGELCSFVAVASVLILEQYVAQLRATGKVTSEIHEVEAPPKRYVA